MPNRLELHEFLCGILGSRNVYYNPPESIKMSYPAIVYHLSNINNRYANNNVYLQNDAYIVTVISKESDIDCVRALSKLSKCKFDRQFSSNNLHHYVFTLYY